MKRKIIIETFPEHLMFVRKLCQAILNLGFGLVVNKFSKVEHIPISNPGDGFQNASPAVWSLCFSWKSELVDYLALRVRVQLYDSFYFSTQKLKFLNKYQIFLRELDENSWKYQTARYLILFLVLWKHLPTAMRYWHTGFKSPLIFHSASILCTSAMFWFFLHYILLNLFRISKLDY